MYLLAQIDQSLLSITGVIATILSVIFGIAAFYNSHTRKKHLKELERAQKQEHAMHFRPAKSSHPGARPGASSRSSLPHQSSSVHGTGRASPPVAKAAPVATSAPHVEKSSSNHFEKTESGSPSRDSRPLFRKVKPSGTGNPELDTERDEKDHYVWE